VTADDMRRALQRIERLAKRSAQDGPVGESDFMRGYYKGVADAFSHSARILRQYTEVDQ
jgi:hypothetical protein